jgi:hypothetical protein
MPEKSMVGIGEVDISDLICGTISQYYKAFGQGVPKTKLLKLVYLTELQYKRRYGARLTGAKWVYYLYGPYLSDYDNILASNNVSVDNFGYSEDKEAKMLSISTAYTGNHIPPDVKFLISGVVRDYGKLDIRSLLDHVYFETEPMINAENRGETLDFDSVMPEDYYKVKELHIDKKTKRALDRDFKKRMEELHAKRH